jgi:TP901 family phage tail tape measure protein
VALSNGFKIFSVFGEVGLSGARNVRSQLGQADAAAEQTAGSFAGSAATMSRFAAGFAIAGLAAGAFAIESVRSFSEFDAAMTESLAIMGDVSNVMRRDMEDAARAVATSTQFSANQAAESFFFLASAGLDAEQSIAALPIVAAFAQAGMFDMAKATDILTDAQSALGLTIRDDAVANMENMARVGDVLVKANTIANASVQQFGEALINRAAPRMRQFNIEVEEGVAVLAAYADQGVKSRLAGMQLNILLRDLTRGAVDNAKAFKALGIEVFNTDGSIRKIADIVEDFEVMLKGASDQQRVMAFEALGLNQRVADSLSTLLGASGAIREYEESLRDAGGIMEEVRDKQLETFRKQMTILGSRIRDVFLIVGRELTPVLTDLVSNALIPIVTWVGRIAETQFPAFLRESVKIVSFWVNVGLTALDKLTSGFQRLFAAIQAGRQIETAGVTIQVEEFLRSLIDTEPELVRLIMQLRNAGEITNREILALMTTFETAAKRIPEELRPGFFLGVLGQLPEELRDTFENSSIEALSVLNQLIPRFEAVGIDMGRALGKGVAEGTEEEIDPELAELRARFQEVLDALAASGKEADALKDILGIASDTRNLLEAQRDLRRGDFNLILEMLPLLDEMEELLKDQTLSYSEQASLLREIKALQEDIKEFLIIDTDQLPDMLDTVPLEQRFFETGKLSAGAFSWALQREMPKATGSALDSIRPDLERAGARLIESLLTGAFEAKDLLRIGINILARRFIMPAFLDALGIGSPSKPMVEIGKTLMDSIGIGIRENAHAPAMAITEAMQPTLLAAQAVLQSPSLRGAAMAGMGGTISLDVSRMTPPSNPLAAARDEKWQEFLRESVLVSRTEGFKV